MDQAQVSSQKYGPTLTQYEEQIAKLKELMEKLRSDSQEERTNARQELFAVKVCPIVERDTKHLSGKISSNRKCPSGIEGNARSTAAIFRNSLARLQAYARCSTGESEVSGSGVRGASKEVLLSTSKYR